MGDVIICLSCSVGFLKTNKSGPNPKRCPPCSKKVMLMQHREAGKRWREKHGDRYRPIKNRKSIESHHRNRDAVNHRRRTRLKNDPVYREKIRIEKLEWSRKNKQKIWAYSLKKYGISQCDYLRMSTEQNGACLICGCVPKNEGPKDRLYVDHCHKKCIVRGLLCGRCNLGIGIFCDDTRILEKAIAYLNRDAAIKI